MCDEDKMIEGGQEMNEIKISGPNDERKMKWIMFTTSLHILESILEYNYEKDTLIDDMGQPWQEDGYCTLFLAALSLQDLSAEGSC